MKRRSCLDNNPKTVTRTYDWDDKIIQIDLCQQHQQDPDFDHFVLEEKI